MQSLNISNWLYSSLILILANSLSAKSVALSKEHAGSPAFGPLERSSLDTSRRFRRSNEYSMGPVGPEMAEFNFEDEPDLDIELDKKRFNQARGFGKKSYSGEDDDPSIVKRRFSQARGFGKRGLPGSADSMKIGQGDEFEEIKRLYKRRFNQARGFGKRDMPEEDTRERRRFNQARGFGKRRFSQARGFGKRRFNQARGFGKRRFNQARGFGKRRFTQARGFGKR